MHRPRFNRYRTGDTARPPRQRETTAIRATDDLLKLLDTRLKHSGADGLVEWLRASPIARADMTTKVCILGAIRRAVPADVFAACREALP